MCLLNYLEYRKLTLVILLYNRSCHVIFMVQVLTEELRILSWKKPPTNNYKGTFEDLYKQL